MYVFKVSFSTLGCMYVHLLVRPLPLLHFTYILTSSVTAVHKNGGDEAAWLARLHRLHVHIC